MCGAAPAGREEPRKMDSMSEQNFPIPPASFDFLVLSLRAQAELQLGLFHFGKEEDGEEKSEPNLPLARHTIDLLAVLLEKTKGNLSLEEQRTLENSLTELRFRFVQVSEEAKKSAPSSSETTSA
jgi:hypothetical protein